MAKIDFCNCPKCGAEIENIVYANINVERCRNCKGLFLDYNDIINPASKKLTIEYAKKRSDAKALDEMVIPCPKCHVLMKKKRAGASKNKLILDICPACNGIWFDFGELERYEKTIKDLFKHPTKLYIKLICTRCGITIDYDDERKDSTHCPLCGEWLDFEGAGEVHEPRLGRKQVTAIIMFFVLLSGLFGITLASFKSVLNAALFTGSIGLVTIVILIRLAVFNRFSWSSAPSGGVGVVREFLVEEDDNQTLSQSKEFRNER